MVEDEYAPRFNVETLLVWLLILILAWAPFPYGSNRPWALNILALALGALSMLWSAAVIFGRTRATPLSGKLLVPGVCFAAAFGWAFIQTLDLAALDRLLSGHTFASLFGHPIWAMASHAADAEIGAFISVDPLRTGAALLATLVGVAAFSLSFELGRDPMQARRLLIAAVAIGCVYAAIGFAELFAGADVHSWLMADAKPRDARLTGSFINPNHFATFSGLAALGAFGHFLETLRRSVVWDRGGKIFARTLLQSASGANAVWLAAALLLLSAVLLTQSRGGIAAFIIGIVVLIACLSMRRNESTPRGVLRWMLPTVLVLVVGGAGWIAAAPIVERAQRQGVEDASRAAIAQATLGAIAAAPLLGNGFGAFERYYPFYADGSVAGDVDRAHNDYLETLADLGIPAGLAFIATPAILAFFCLRGAMRRNRDRIFPAVGAAATALVGTHALVDFSLQIPAVSVLFATLLGLGVSQAWSTAQRPG